ncbi:hypothetical protein [Methanobacterium sp. BAmetb5]|uniref:hypothetical protein n=1 Tax=Methanobacterium sp. BAmetb5 TaxID=2025351 RepID=UPI000E929529|nr:hypothetical protein [Methanobacterium sp. BAmetb5]AXV39692.1 MAG: hypothetical protein CIT02_04895 [Methanobacterium sp. BAmetb5]
MKMKFLPIVLIALISVCGLQPLFAANPQLEDTKIATKIGEPLPDITVSAGSEIELQARLYWYYYAVDSAKATWIPQICRYLDFYVYDSSNNLVWSDSAITNFFTANANPDKFTLNKKGTYTLIVKHEGNLKHCQSTAKINVI